MSGPKPASVPLWKIHRRNKTSGKSRGGILAAGLTEYVAKTVAMDANRGSRTFRYTVIDPSGERLKFLEGEKGAGAWIYVYEGAKR